MVLDYLAYIVGRPLKPLVRPEQAEDAMLPADSCFFQGRMLGT